MNKKLLITSFFVLLLSIASIAHEFWMQPSRFRVKINEEVPIEFLVGENFDGEAWDLKTHKILKLNLHSLATVVDLTKQFTPTEKIKLKIKLPTEGTRVVSMESDDSFIELDADKFNDYLKEDGLEEVLDLRANAGNSSKPGREFFTRYAKLLLQAGDKTDDTFKKKIGLKIEIVPLQNPYALHTGDYLDCQVVYEGKPLPHQLVKVWNKIGINSFLQDIYTENDGTIRFPISAKGMWMVSTVKMIPSEKAGADWHSMWGSLVFGI